MDSFMGAKETTLAQRRSRKLFAATVHDLLALLEVNNHMALIRKSLEQSEYADVNISS
jgi:hypothetical protein